MLRETAQKLQTNIERELDIVLRKMKGIPEVTEYENRCVADKHPGDFNDWQFRVSHSVYY
jgi:hypothetical protein